MERLLRYQEGVFPDFQKTTLVNLMSTVGGAMGAATPYPPLRHPALETLEERRHVVLLVVDGLGCEQLERLGADSRLARCKAGQLTSVFPATTSAAVTSLMTGEPPAVHGLTGWFTFSRETGQIVMPLPLWVRHPQPPRVSDQQALADSLFRAPSLFNRMTRRTLIHQPAFLAGSPYSRHHGGSALPCPWKTFAGLADNLLAECRHPEPTFHYAYIPQLDTTMHEAGPDSEEARILLAQIDAELSRFIDGKDSATQLIVTADHGFVATGPHRHIDLGGFPELVGELAQPVSGEPRAVFCHVKEGRREHFMAAAERLVGHAAWCVTGETLLASGLLGPGDHHPLLASRIGDVVLLAKENWTLGDRLPHEKPFDLLGIHGGISAAEMNIPLIVA